MGTFSIWHWLIVLAVVLVLFGGGGKISRMMGDMAKGVKAFKKGLKEEEETAETPAKKSIDEEKSATVEATAAKDEAAKG